MQRAIHCLMLIPVLLVILTACAPEEEALPPQSSIIYGLTLEPSGIDPHRNQSAELGIPLRQVYDTLVYRDPDTQAFVPGLAESWEVSEDGLAYTFTLRQDVTFHDGTAFNAAAVGANLDRITDPELASQKARFMLGPYTGYEILDEYTIRINLSQSYAPLLDSFSQVYLGMASPAALEEYSANRYQFHQVGTGPYRFVEYTTGSEIVLQKNDDYAWGPSFYDEVADAAPGQITYRFFADPPTRATALESGEAQIMGELLPADARALTTNSQVQVLPTPIPGQPMQFLFNIEQFPTTSPAVRQALIYATNRTAIIDTVFQGFSPVAWGPLTANTLYYDPTVFGIYDYDIQQAQDILTAAGFSDEDNNGFLDAGDGDLEVTMIVPPWGLTPEVAQLIQDQWRAVGVSAVIEQVPGFAALQEAVNSGEYNMVAFNSFGYDPALLTEFFITDGANNFSNYGNPELDRALLAAVAETNPDLRRQMYAQIQQLVMQEALLLPIRDYVNLNATDTAVENLQFDLYGWFPIINNAVLVER